MLSNFPIDPRWQEQITRVLASIQQLVRPEEVDRLLAAYQVQQAKNQYEYILKITAVRHEARLFDLQSQLEQQKALQNAKYTVGRLRQIEVLILNSRRATMDDARQITQEMDRHLAQIDRTRDPKLKALARRHAEDAYASSLDAIEAASEIAVAEILAQLIAGKKN